MRTLKIEETGDPWKKDDLRPRIRLHGKWLAHAGFCMGKRVVVTIERPGLILLRVYQPQPKESSESEKVQTHEGNES